METTAPSATASIRDYFEADHNRLDELLRQFQQLKRIDFAKAKPFFREFKFGLQRHITWEEEILFPFFEQKTGSGGFGPTDVMRREHILIKERLEEAHNFVKRSDPDGDIAERSLEGVLAAHNAKEEIILYPALDVLSSEEERNQILLALQHIPEERYRVCCGGHVHPAGKA